MTPTQGFPTAEHETPGIAARRVALSAVDVHCAFGGVHAVDGATLEFRGGEITGLIGPNGAGKSTMVNALSGFVRPAGGRIVFEGTDVTGWAPHKIAQLGLVRTFQLSSEFSQLTVMENLLAAARLKRGNTIGGALLGRRWWRDEERRELTRAQELLERFGLEAAVDEYAGLLSGGQKRILEISRALMAEPKLLLLDEPLAGVNPTTALVIEEHLMTLRAEGLTMVLVEHEMGAIERLCESVVVMSQGRVLATGRMQDHRANQEVIDAYLGG